MLKEIIKKCANFMGRDDIVRALEDSTKNTFEDFEDDEIKYDLHRLMLCYNNVVTSVFENYLELIQTEEIATNSNGEIFYNYLTKLPVKIIQVEDMSKNLINFKANLKFIKTNYSNKLFTITYRYVPKEAKDLDDVIETFSPSYEMAICYGIIGEFLSFCGKYSESVSWKEKFENLLFNLKTKRERRVKSTYAI